MTSIWQNDGSVWKLLSPKRFPNESTLHSLVEHAPQMLPLSGDPRLVVVGKEVYLNGNYADLIGIEPDGRLSIIEIKLSTNAEARRAVIAQVLTYAASLAGNDRKTLEQEPTLLGSYLQKLGVSTLAGAMTREDQTEQIDIEQFNNAFDAQLREGAFRLVIVLDDAPPELIRLVGYLESITEKLVIDLITVSSFDVEGSQIVVPNRIDPEQELHGTKKSMTVPTSAPVAIDGVDAFIEGIEQAPSEAHSALRRVADWVVELERGGLAEPSTTVGKSRRILNVRIPSDSGGLISVYNEGGAYITFYRSVFSRRAPASIARVEAALHPKKLGQGTTTSNISEELLAELKDAYREAREGVITPIPSQPTPGPDLV